MEMSFYHNMIVTCTNSNKIYIWDYEFAKLKACLYLNKSVEPTALTFINGYSFLLIAINTGKLLIVHFKEVAGENKTQFKIIAVVNLKDVPVSMNLNDEIERNI